MKKDELLTVCREQEALLQEARQTLDGYRTALATRENEIDRLNVLLSAQAGSLNFLAAENERLQTEIAQAASIYQAEFEKLSAGYRASIETLNRSLSKNFSELENSLRQRWEDGLASLATRSKDEDPSEYERMLMAWFMDFMADLEDSLKRPPA